VGGESSIVARGRRCSLGGVRSRAVVVVRGCRVIRSELGLLFRWVVGLVVGGGRCMWTASRRCCLGGVRSRAVVVVRGCWARVRVEFTLVVGLVVGVARRMWAASRR
jgi:hypothetical protein